MWWASFWRDGLLAALLAFFLLRPVVTLIAYDLTPTGMAEESVGRRYFYSLRIVYGEHERPWLPQGHLTSVAHFGIQHALTALGYPPNELFPRIDLFAYAASVLPLVLAVAAFCWAVRPIGNVLGKLLVALLLLAAAFDPGTSRGYHLVQTDYYAWVHAVAFVSIGAILRVVRAQSSLGPRTGLLLGAFAAVAISIKPTYLTFVAPVAILLLVHGLSQRQWLRVLCGLLAAGATAVAGTLAVFLTYYVGDLAGMIQHVANLAGFVESIEQAQSLPTWLGVALSRWREGVTLPATIVTIPVLALSALLLPRRWISVSLLVGAVGSAYVAWRKFHPNTLIETNDYTFVAVTVWTTLVLLPALTAWVEGRRLPLQGQPRIWPATVTVAGLVLGTLFGTHVYRHAENGRYDIVKYFGAATSSSRALTEHLASRPGRVAYLIPEHQYRPLTVDSAIYKGGTNEIGARWGQSPYAIAMFPDRHYFVDGRFPERDPELDQFRHIVFVRFPTEVDEAALNRRLRERFGFWLQSYECGFRADAIDQELVSCERRVVQIAADDLGVARFVPAGGDLTAGADSPPNLVATERGSGQPLNLWQLRADGSMAAVEAPDGAEVRVAGIGAWNPSDRTLSGLTATFASGRLHVDASHLKATNENPRFDQFGPRNRPLVGWQLEPRDALPTVERLSDEGGPFVRLRPGRDRRSIVVQSREPLSKLDDTPVTVRAVVRAHGPKPVTVSIADVVARNGQSVTPGAVTQSSDTWETLTVWLDRARFPDERDSFSVKLADPAPESWLDLREVSLIEGIVP